jgi:hypothetical protein
VGDLVVAEKRRNGESRIWIGRMHLVRGAWEIHYESDNERWQNEQPVQLDQDVEIVGLVRGVYRPMVR